jgi:hypothetical protein
MNAKVNKKIKKIYRGHLTVYSLAVASRKFILFYRNKRCFATSYPSVYHLIALVPISASIDEPKRQF